MPRFFGTRNKISICHPLSILWLCILSLVLLFILRQDAASKLMAKTATVETPSSVGGAGGGGVGGASAAPTSRIFCVIVTYGYRHRVAFHIYHTWLNQCDKYLFVSDDSHEILEPAVFQKLPDKWQRLRAYMDYIYRYHINEGDWFLIANDDNFVMVENLRFMLEKYSSDELIYFGCKLKNPQGQVYMLEACSMVLSRSAIERFVLAALPSEELCSSKSLGNAAYEEFGRCLGNVQVMAGDSRDDYQMHRFLPFEPTVHLGIDPLNISIEEHKYFIERSYYDVQDLKVPVSSISISFHMKLMDRIYDFYYFTQRVKNFGLPRDPILWT